MVAHAKLSASGSHRWINCPGSVFAESGNSDSSSVHAQWGTAAHELGEILLTQGGNASDWIGKQLVESNETTVDQEMANCAQEYVNYVRQFDGELIVEQTFDFSDWVPGGFGTADTVIIQPDATLRVIDLKGGKGVRVDAEQNSQGMLYALGVYSELSMIHDIERAIITIVQPRLDHISEWEISVPNLLKWGAWVADRAELALSAESERNPGEKQCQFCKAKAKCPALKKYTERILLNDFDDIDDISTISELNDDQLRQALDAKKLIVGWLDAVASHVRERLENGEGFDGYKLVAGRSLRAWADTDLAEKALADLLGDDAFERKLVTPAKAEKALGKTKAKQISELIVKPEGKPVIAQSTDKRAAINIDKNDFEVLT